jgi:S1-C subfamily serine protease
MKRAAVYSGSPVRRAAREEVPEVPREKSVSWRERLQPHRRRLRIAGFAVAALFLILAAWTWGPALRGVSQADVEAAIQRALDANPPKPTAADAYEKILPSLVHVRSFTTDEESAREKDEKWPGPEPRTVDPKATQPANPAAAKPLEGNIGTGVVIVDTGIILTNLHVVNGAKRVKVTFFDGLEADAEVIGVRPDTDLAVLQAKKIPDDLFAATMRSTSGLRLGDDVVAVGFPFGIGPSVSAGVVSGLKREYQSQDGSRILGNLIQFDAAVNPGNSGGPLVTTEGEVVGIVTGLLNPTEQRVFIGIGFAVPIENAAAAAGLSPF